MPSAGAARRSEPRAMSAGTPRAAAPLALGGLLLRNRLVGTAHGRGLLEDGLALPADAEYWRRRGGGGAGLAAAGRTATAPGGTWPARATTAAWRPAGP